MLYKIGSRYCQIDFCRGMMGRCRFSLVGGTTLFDEFIELLDRTETIEKIDEHDTKILHHMRLKLALAACPNACTMPQIKDVGIIARLFPRETLQKCTRCGICLQTCRENAIEISDRLPLINRDQCLGCGSCILACPVGAIAPFPLQFNVLIGGRMGRRPQWAVGLTTVSELEFIAQMDHLLSIIKYEMSERERFADVIEQEGLKKLKERFSYA